MIQAEVYSEWLEAITLDLSMHLCLCSINDKILVHIYMYIEFSYFTISSINFVSSSKMQEWETENFHIRPFAVGLL